MRRWVEFWLWMDLCTKFVNCKILSFTYLMWVDLGKTQLNSNSLLSFVLGPGTPAAWLELPLRLSRPHRVLALWCPPGLQISEIQSNITNPTWLIYNKLHLNVKFYVNRTTCFWVMSIFVLLLGLKILWTCETQKIM